MKRLVMDMKRLVMDREMGLLVARTIAVEANPRLGEPGELLSDANLLGGVVLVGDYESSSSIFELYLHGRLPDILSRWRAACDECVRGRVANARNDARAAEQFMRRYPGTNLVVQVRISLVPAGHALNVSGEPEYRVVVAAHGARYPNAKTSELARRRRLLLVDTPWPTSALRFAVTMMARGLLD